jgi:hypothetical protein
VKELEKGVFDGWSEGALNFPPTYKYEINSDKYIGEDPKVARRTPAWYALVCFNRDSASICVLYAFIHVLIYHFFIILINQIVLSKMNY